MSLKYDKLINELIKHGVLKTPLIIGAFRRIKRADFLPSKIKKDDYLDVPLPIGFSQTNSQPLTVALMLEFLLPQAGQRILDVGSGSGWTTALLAWCVGKTGKIFAVENIKEIFEFGKKNILKYNFIEQRNVEMFWGDGSRGLLNQAPFDRILVSAAAEKIPVELKKQLAIGGRLVIPVKNSIWLVIKIAEEKFEEKEFFGFSFVPLMIDDNH